MKLKSRGNCFILYVYERRRYVILFYSLPMSLLAGKTILVTGGTGTFGHAFVSRVLSVPEVKKVIVLSRDEFKQSEMAREIPDERIRFFLGDVRDLARLNRAFQGVDIVVHAAALKQVPALEYNPFEAVKTNIQGTQNVIDAALDNNVEKMIFISSDKAVYPGNLYGATKLCAERLVVAANAYRGNKRTKLSVMRYGNVLGSRGSLVDVLKRQRGSGVVTLTDRRMTRFWITLDKVTDMVVQGTELMHGGEIFVPKMKSIFVSDVIKTLAPECRIEVIGIRPGEKLHETLITEHEARRTKDFGEMFVILPEFEWVVEDRQWIDSKPSLPETFVYASNSPEFLLPKDAAHTIFV